jgi:hypothetical protein
VRIRHHRASHSTPALELEAARDGAHPRLSRAGIVWTLVLIGVLAPMLVEGLYYTRAIQGTHTICGAVPSYSDLQLEPGDKTVGLILNAGAGSVLEPLFCAQYDLAPRVVVGVNSTSDEIWSALQRFPLIVDAPETRAWAEKMEHSVRQRGISTTRLERRDYANGLMVLRLRADGWR